ncbi:hypothetical protein B0H63DRAFT_378961, partial [Podospora didyma]
MELVGIVRCPVRSLVPYRGRHLNPKQVKRLARRFKRTECQQTEERNQIRGIITFEDLETILTTLGTSREGLQATVRGGGYPLLSGHRIACLDGRHRLAAVAVGPDCPTAWWAVKLCCVRGTWVEFPLKIELPPTIASQVQREVEHDSHESKYRDGELFTMICESRTKKSRDKDRENECWDRLSDPKAANLRRILNKKKHRELTKALRALSKFPGVIWGLQLGNIHKLLTELEDLIIHCFGHIL